MSSGCLLVDGDNPYCSTHDVLLDPAWPDAMTTTPALSDYICPLEGEPA